MKKQAKRPKKSASKNIAKIKWPKVIGLGIFILCLGVFVGYLFITKDVSIKLVESKTGTAIADAEVTFNGKQYVSDSTGLITFSSVRFGKKTAQFFKPFYNQGNITFTLQPFSKQKQQTVYMNAVGEVVSASVKNKLTGRIISGATIRAIGGGQGRTDSKGRAILVLPYGTKSSDAVVSAEDIVEAKVTIFNANDAATNVFLVIPKAKVYTMQKNSNGVSVTERNFDGSDQKTVVSSTGLESAEDTQLLMSPSARYFVLKSRRDLAGLGKLHVYDTKNLSLETLEQEDQSYIPVGWIGMTFVYRTYNQNVPLWQEGRETLKSYNAVTKKITTLDVTRGEGAGVQDYVSETYEATYLLEGKVFYTKKWQSSYYYGGRYINKNMLLESVNSDASNKKVIGQWQAGYNTKIKSVQSGPKKLNIFIELDGVNRTNYEYFQENVQSVISTDVSFTNKDMFSDYFLSPNGLLTVWTEDTPNGTVSYVIGDNGQLGRNLDLGSLKTKVSGWYDDDYILMTSTAGQLYVGSRLSALSSLLPLKVGDFYMPTNNYRAFGYGR